MASAHLDYKKIKMEFIRWTKSADKDFQAAIKENIRLTETWDKRVKNDEALVKGKLF
jgi:hypothetical protein